MAFEPLFSPSSHSSQDSTTPLPQFCAVISSSLAHEAVRMESAKSDAYRSVSCFMTTPQSAWCLALISVSPRYASKGTGAIVVPYAFAVRAVSRITRWAGKSSGAVMNVTKRGMQLRIDAVRTTSGVGFPTMEASARLVGLCGRVGGSTVCPKAGLGHSRYCFWVNRR